MHLHRNSCEPLGRIRCRSCGGLRQALPHILHHARDGFVRHSLRACGHPQHSSCAGGEGGEHSLADGLAELLRDRRPANLHYDLGRHRVANVLGEGLAAGLHGGGGRPGVWWHRSAVLERCPSRCPSRRRLGGGDGGGRGGGDRGGRAEQWRGKYRPCTGGVMPEVGFRVHRNFCAHRIDRRTHARSGRSSLHCVRVPQLRLTKSWIFQKAFARALGSCGLLRIS
mmetsp:Transcript_83316/g.268554  ORF Transcript_83316/g.268554 Transcript_83316/m.268554 type:complete len:225 (+) Transcript_83316:1199-1873(+)